MTRYYAADHVDRYRRCSNMGSMTHYITERSMPMSVSHNVRQDVRACPVTRQGRHPSVRDVEPENINGPPRRRIPVACGRCRKRKIRCSGDPGDGTGCQNCRLAGADINACQFHRVHSVSLECQVSLQGLPQQPTHVNGVPAASQLQGITTTSANYPFCSPYPRQHSNAHNAVTSGRVHPPSPWLVPMTEETSIDPYNVHAPSTLSRDPLGSVWGSAENLRSYVPNGWRPVSTDGNYTDADSGPYGASPYYAHAAVARQPPVTTDGISPFGMTSLHSSLHASLVDRQLPMPTAQRSNSSASLTESLHIRPLSSSNPNLMGMHSQISYTKAAMPWAIDPIEAEGRQNSISSIISAGAGSPPLTHTTASSSSGSEPISLGYIPVTSSCSPEPSPVNVSVSQNTDSSPTPTPSVGMRYVSSAKMAFPTSASEEVLLPKSESSSNLYSFSSDSSSKVGSLGDASSTEAVIVGGQRYTPLVHPHPQHMASIESLRRDSYDRPALVQRLSVSSLNSRGF